MNQIIKDLLTAYGAVLFSGRKRTGIFFLLATFLNPLHGLIGLIGALTAHLTALSMKVDRSYHKAGVFGASGLLTGLALSLYIKPTPSLFILVPLCAVLSAFFTAVSVSILGWKYGIPSLALPFVFATWVGLLADKVAIETGWFGKVIEPFQFEWINSLDTQLAIVIPKEISTFLKVVSATSLQTNVFAGLLILIGIVLGTRITAIAMIFGTLIGMGTVLILSGNQLPNNELILAAFNCVFAAGALGGVFVLPNRNGILFAIFGTILVGLLSIATQTYFRQEQLPPLAFPFSIGVIVLLIPFRLGLFTGIHLYPLASVGTAEANLRQYWKWLRKASYPFTVLSFPHFGKWTVTQGNDTFPTHTGVGKYSWDFMLLDDQERSAAYPGLALSDYYGYGMPVLAPANGTVVAVENSIPDNPPQTVNTENPYGNFISIYHAPNEYSILAHLKQNSVKVVVGQPVYIGQEIAKVGNSGRSPEPHLHIALQSNWYPLAQTIPAKWQGLLVFRNGKWNYLTNSSPQKGDVVANYFAMNTVSLEEFFPWSILGAEWLYRISSKHSQEEVRLLCRPGLYGRFLLDDGAIVIQAIKTYGHWQMSHLDETDPDFKSNGKSKLLERIIPAITILPLYVGTKFEWENEVTSRWVASPLKRFFELSGYGKAKAKGYTLRITELGTPQLHLHTQVITETNEEFDYHLIFEKHIGLMQVQVIKNKNLLYSIDLLNYQSRLHSWHL
ncbi:MAG: urea transporter [bacterium]|nr:urea transporter [bacterium]